ncbi:MAG: Mu transposase domain-containing protein [Actinomycetes bacterium]
MGSLAHSSRWRAVLAAAEDQPHLIEALDAVARRLGGLTLRWRFDRMATVCHPDSGRLSATFGPVAAHYAVGIDICPPRRGNRKGVVEKANHSAAQRWWRTLADELSPVAAQASLDRFCVRVGDARPRRVEGQRSTVGALAAGEGLRPVPTGPYPAVLSVERQVSAQGLVPFRGNSYSIGPGRGGATVSVTHRLGTATLDVITPRGVVLARHRRAPDSAGVVVRHDEHVAAMERSVLAAFTDRAPCRRKLRRPPSADARAEATRLRGAGTPGAGVQVVIDFAPYAAAAVDRQTLATGTTDTTGPTSRTTS